TFAWRQRSILRRSSSVRWLYFDPMTQSSCLITYWFQTEVALGNSAHPETVNSKVAARHSIQRFIFTLPGAFLLALKFSGSIFRIGPGSLTLAPSITYVRKQTS
ncbi:MAG: hypothetical protein NXH99_18405, partial [Rhodobacteraceae bacterium]|nr:hypothetical protein [Paracoccaceae bacterium]